MCAQSNSASQAEIEQRLRFEMLLADICAEFVNVAPADLDSKIENAQRLICKVLGVDHSSVWQISDRNPDLLVMTHAYRDANLKPLPSRPILSDYFPWSQRKLLQKQIVSVPNTEKVPPEAALDRKSWLGYGVRSTLAFPLWVGGGSVIGLLAFDSTEERDWPEPLQRRLQMVAHVFAQALERKQAEQKVLESENRFRLIADNAPVLIWMSGVDKLCTYLSRSWLDFTGKSIEEELGNGWSDGVHPEDFRRCLDTYTGSFDRREKFRMEYRLRRHDGEYRWILDIGVPRFNQDRSFAGYIGIAVDVTERKQAEEALASVNRKLIEAQEQERARIGRELHDDINQRLALLAIELDQLQDIPSGLQKGVQELRKQIIEISSDVQTLSHELHSSKLEFLGVVAGIRNWCKDFAERQRMEIDFTSNVPSRLPHEIGICLFRILQEALHNAIKHSGVKRIEVQLTESSNEVQLIVSDLGRGFDREAALQEDGLGFISMRERVRLVNGTITIDSKPMAGTTIRVRVPFTSEHASREAVGH